MSSWVSRLTGVLLVSATIVAGVAAPATAAEYVRLTSGSWAYVDSAAPRTSFVDPPGNAPVGAQVFASGTVHKFKSYITFDLSPLRGTHVISASLVASEATVADCTAPRATQAWLTEPIHAPTWARQPAELRQLAGGAPPPGCPWWYVEWPATEVLQKAIQEGRPSVTFVLRLPEDQQADQRFGHTFDPRATLVVNRNKAPGKPAALQVNHTDCGPPKVVPGSDVELAMTASDPDDSQLDYEVAYWPVRQPGRRTTLLTRGSSGYRAMTHIDADKLTDGTAYAWQVRAKDALDTGPWSAVCTFSTDFVRPDKAPLLSSLDYSMDAPPGTGGTGIPGEFTFTPNGVKDVVGYYYGEFDPVTFVAANPRTREATIRHTPARSGPLSFAVASVDAAGNRSDTTSRRFWVAQNQPLVECTPRYDYVGVPRDCVFRSPSPATAFVYTFRHGFPAEVPIGPDGSAHVRIVPTEPELFNSLDVRARLGNGNLTAATSYNVGVNTGEPTVNQPATKPIVGRPAQFTLISALPGSVAFTYSWDDGDPVTVPLGPDGAATITVTPQRPYYTSLSVHTTTADGIRSGTTTEYIDVLTNAPAVSSTDYPENTSSGEVGLPGTFTFTAATSDTVSITYAFGDQTPITVPVGADGTVTLDLAPPRPNANNLLVTGTLADGTVTQQRLYYFLANPVEPHVTCDADHPSAGEHFHCTFTPAQSNVVSYVYRWGQNPEVTVPAAADHTATVELVVPRPVGDFVSLSAWSVNSLGHRSGELSTGISTTPGHNPETPR
ncbi:MAG: DNRLRE domain-containing protein [Kibdelosporangium sp.]